MLKSKENEEAARADQRDADLESVVVLERTLVPGSNTRLIRALGQLYRRELNITRREVRLFSLSYYPANRWVILDPDNRDRYAEETFIDGGVVVTWKGDGRFMISPRRRNGRASFHVHRIDAGKFGIVYKLGADFV